MTKQFSIPARDHFPSTFEQVHDGMALGSGLPFVAGQLARPEDDLGNFLLGRAVVPTIEGLQHAPRACPLLIREAGIWRRLTAIKGGEQPQDRVNTAEAIGSERNQGCKRRVGRCAGCQHEMDVLAVAE